MRKLLLSLSLLALSSLSHAGQYDGIWLESADGTYTVYSSIYTASNGMMYKIDHEPESGQSIAGSWDATTFGMLTGNTATLSGESKQCNVTLSLTFTSTTTATMRVVTATSKPGKSCDWPQGASTTIQKLF
jgi:hypothetical protein